jgi:hypothetical protein
MSSTCLCQVGAGGPGEIQKNDGHAPQNFDHQGSQKTICYERRKITAALMSKQGGDTATHSGLDRQQPAINERKIK